MPVLPVSDFWQRSFTKYYKLRWVQQDLRNNQILVKYNISIVVVMALILYMIVLCIPISTNVSFNSSPRKANPYLYVTYQCVYTYFSYPCTMFLFEIAFPNTLRNKYVRRYVLPIPIFIIITAIYVIYSPIIPTIYTKGEYARTLGPFLSSWYAALVFIVVIYSKMCYNSLSSNNDNDNDDIIDDEDNEYRNMGSVQFSKSSISFSISKQTQHTADYTTINSTILFENSEISDDNDLSDGDNNHINYVNRPILQTLYALICTAGISGIYYFCEYLTWQWKKQSNETISNNDSSSLLNKINYILLLYPSFWICTNMIKFVTTRFARFADSNKTSSYSLEILSSFFFTCFYYVFYRNLFLHITSYGYFVFVKLLHITLELLTYVLRISKWYFDKTRSLQDKLTDNNNNYNLGIFQPIIWVLYDPSEYHVWSVRLCLDYTLSFIVSVGSGISYISGVLWLKYGYNQYFYDIKDIEKQQYDKVLIFTAISIFVEFLTYFIIEKLMKYQFQIDVIKHWRALIHHRPGYIYYFIFMLQHVQTDVMIAKLINV